MCNENLVRALRAATDELWVAKQAESSAYAAKCAAGEVARWAIVIELRPDGQPNPALAAAQKKWAEAEATQAAWMAAVDVRRAAEAAHKAAVAAFPEEPYW